MSRRLKQIIYGAFYIIFFASISYGVYRGTLKPPASCFDGVMNQDEIEVDCGGAFCESCDIRRLLPLRAAGVTVVPVSSNESASVLVEFQNPNPQYGATAFNYVMQLIGQGDEIIHSEESSSFIYPSEVKYITFVGLPIRDTSSIRSLVTISDPVWKTGEAMSVPQIQIREVKLTESNSSFVITGVLRNNSPFGLLNVTAVGVVSEEASREVVALSKTVIRDITVSEERFFQIAVPLDAGSDIDTLSAKVFIEARR